MTVDQVQASRYYRKIFFIFIKDSRGKTFKTGEETESGNKTIFIAIWLSHSLQKSTVNYLSMTVPCDVN